MSLQHDIRIEKVTLNIGAGKEVQRLEKAVHLLKQLTNRQPVKTITNKRIPGWGLRPGLPIGCKVTLRKEEAATLLRQVLHAKDHKLNAQNFDRTGNLSFGVKEYVDIDGAKYNPEIGMLGLDIAVTLEKPGYHIKKRKIKRAHIGKRQLVSREEAMEYVAKQFKVTIEA